MVYSECMLSSADFLNLGVGFSVIVMGICVALVTYQLVGLLGSAKKIVDEVESTTHDLATMKDAIKVVVSGLARKFMEKLTIEGGDTKKNDSKKHKE